MDTIKINHKGVKVIAHRGASGLECENSAAAFVAAGNRSYFGIETDVHLTKDGKFVIIHDDNTKRVTGVDRIVEESTLAEIREARLLSLPYRDAESRSDLIIPELDEYIKICRHYNKTAVLELKNPMPESAIIQICEVVMQNDYSEQTIFISFDWDNLCVVRNAYPKQKIQFLTTHWDDSLIEKLVEKRIDLDILYTELSKEIVEKLHEKSILVNCWTCDTPEDAEKVIEYGVDFITSNILE